MGRLIPATRAVTSLTRSGARYGLDGIGGAAGLAVATHSGSSRVRVTPVSPFASQGSPFPGAKGDTGVTPRIVKGVTAVTFSVVKGPGAKGVADVTFSGS